MKLFTHYPTAQQGDRHAAMNWRENYLNDSLFYSCRCTRYNRQTYPASLHYHDYYELVVFLGGDIHYICEGEVFSPRRGDVILIPPGSLHMSMLEADETTYERHVFYLYPDAFEPMGLAELTAFLQGGSRMTTAQACEELLSLLPRLDQALAGEHDRERALAVGLTIQIFYLLGGCRFDHGRANAGLPQNVRDIQRYLDENFACIESVAEVAKHFYYSREYVSRLFRQHFNTTVADYLMKRRVAHAQALIAQGSPLSEACFQSGFGDLTTFIRAFKRVTGITPSRYKREVITTG